MSNITINGVDIKLTAEQAKAIVDQYAQKKDSGWHDGGKGEYISFTGIGNIATGGYLHTGDRYKNASLFSTEAKAKEINFKETLWRKVQRWADEHNKGEFDWENDSTGKYYIYFNSCTKVGCMQEARDFGNVYFTSQDLATQCSNEFQTELLQYFRGEWDG